MKSVICLFRQIVLFLCAVVVFTGVQAAPAADDNNSIVLTFLGTGAPRPSLKRFGPTIMVEAGKHRFLVDAMIRFGTNL